MNRFENIQSQPMPVEVLKYLLTMQKYLRKVVEEITLKSLRKDKFGGPPQYSLF